MGAALADGAHPTEIFASDPRGHPPSAPKAGGGPTRGSSLPLGGVDHPDGIHPTDILASDPRGEPPATKGAAGGRSPDEVVQLSWESGATLVSGRKRSAPGGTGTEPPVTPGGGGQGSFPLRGWRWPAPHPALSSQRRSPPPLVQQEAAPEGRQGLYQTIAGAREGVLPLLPLR